MLGACNQHLVCLVLLGNASSSVLPLSLPTLSAHDIVHRGPEQRHRDGDESINGRKQSSGGDSLYKESEKAIAIKMSLTMYRKLVRLSLREALHVQIAALRTRALVYGSLVAESHHRVPHTGVQTYGSADRDTRFSLSVFQCSIDYVCNCGSSGIEVRAG